MQEEFAQLSALWRKSVVEFNHEIRPFDLEKCSPEQAAVSPNGFQPFRVSLLADDSADRAV